MTTNDPFERRLVMWLDEDAVGHVPTHLDEVLAQSAVTRQRAWWSSLERWLPVDLASPRSVMDRIFPMRPLALLVALVFLLAALVAISIGTQRRAADPYGIAGNGSFVYESDGDIYLADQDGSNPRSIVTGPSRDLGPVYAYDGGRFAFVREVSPDHLHLVAADADGSDVRVLTKEQLQAPDWWDWSADGDEIVVLHTVDGQRRLSILATDGSGSLTTLELGTIEPDRPMWRPTHGDEIIFRGFTQARGSVTLYSVRRDGTGLRAIAPLRSEEFSYNDVYLSSDGTRATYWNWDLDQSDDGAGPWIHILDVETGTDTRMAFDPASDGELSPQFSPDGASLLFIRGIPSRLVIAPVDGSTAGRSIGPTFETYDNPHVFGFSPDGTKVILTIERSGEAWLVDVADGTFVEVDSLGFYASWQRTP
jgi:hypothetical protein